MTVLVLKVKNCVREKCLANETISRNSLLINTAKLSSEPSQNALGKPLSHCGAIESASISAREFGTVSDSKLNNQEFLRMQLLTDKYSEAFIGAVAI